MNKYIALFLHSEINSISGNDRKQFFEKSLSVNLSREKTYAILLIIWNVFMVVYIGLGALNGTWARMPEYKYEFYLHIVGLLIPVLFLWRFLNKSKFKSSVNLGFILFAVYWTAAMALVDLSINQQLIVYSIGIMAVSVSLIMNPKESCLIYISSYILIAVGTLLTQNRAEIIESSILNGLILVVLGIVISKIIFSFNVKDFIKNLTIEAKTAELERSQIILERALSERTEELALANEQLVQEINVSHALEIQALESELKYQKKLIALNEAMEYEKIRGEFFTNISHELRTPLNIIFCTLQMINSFIKNGIEIDKVRMSRYMNLMHQNCYRLTRLINNIIDITKIDSGYFKINLRNQNIVKIVEDITLSVIPFAEYNGFNVIFNSEMEEKVIACDPDMIERIILNLLSNAIKFSVPNGNIYISLFEMNNYVIIKVRDNGIGIPEDKQRTIFDRFIQVDKSTSRGREGSGIGLSLVKSLVEMHNGIIDVISELGKGSEFIIELPDVTVKSDQESAEYSSNNLVDKTEVVRIEFSDIYTMEYK